MLALLGLMVPVVSVMYTMTLHMQLVWGWTALLAGVASLPRVVAMFAAGPFVERCVRRLGHRGAVVAFGVLLAAGTLLYAVGARHGYAWMVASVIPSVLGMRGVLTVASVDLVRALPADRTSLAASLSDACQEVGNGMGVAVVGTLLAVGLGSAALDAPWTGARLAAFDNAETWACIAAAVLGGALMVAGGLSLPRRGDEPVGDRPRPEGRPVGA